MAFFLLRLASFCCFLSYTFVKALSVNSTILFLASSSDSLSSTKTALEGYGIPYILALSAAVPVLNNSVSHGNFAGIIIEGDMSSSQLQQIYSYQTTFGVRLVRYDIEPSTEFGTRAARGGCCASGVEQLVSISNTTFFPTAGLKTGAGMTTQELWHVPAVITDSSIASEAAQFGASDSFSTATTAAVVNRIGKREQMIWFMPFEFQWSITANYLVHSWIHFLTRGLYTGYRRVNLLAQVDDVHLPTDLYGGGEFRIRAQDLEAHKTWMPSLRAKLNPGSDFFIELAHNGNGNIQSGTVVDSATCSPGPIFLRPYAQTDPEFKKPLGTGSDVWPLTPTIYVWNDQCLGLDTVEQWFSNSENLNVFAHMSHTFTHLSLNNATYADVSKEISLNRQWLTNSGIAAATRFSPSGLVPPAMTGLHNGDALKAWVDNGITTAVGDNTRETLINDINEHWPLITTLEDNGYAGFPIIGRWASNIYFNCDTTACTEAQYAAGTGSSATFQQILDIERSANIRHLLSLRRDPFMFHQANMRQADIAPIPVNGVSGKYSLLQVWIEIVVQELVRLVTWPVITLKHDDIAAAVIARRTRDLCSPSMVYTLNNPGTAIESATVSAGNPSCSARIPLTLPVDVTNRGTASAEKVGDDPLTLWVQLAGASQTFTLQTAIPVN